MERATSINTGITNSASSIIPQHEYVLMRKPKDEGKPLERVGYVQRDPNSRFLSYKVVSVSETGDVVDIGLLVDSTKDGELVLKAPNPDYNTESPEPGTYAKKILFRFFKHLSKSGNVYLRGSTAKVGEPNREVYMMFSNDGKGPASRKK